MGKKKKICNFLCLIIFANFIDEIKSDNDNKNSAYKIRLNFQSTGIQALYCDDNIQFFEKGKIKFLCESKINIAQIFFPFNFIFSPYLVKNTSSHLCKSQIKFNNT